MWVKRITKQGNSLGVVVPIELCRSLEINKGDFVMIMLGSDDTIFIKRITDDMAKSLENNGQRNKT